MDMTAVTFHFNVSDRTDYICRLVRKAARLGSQVVLSGPSASLEHFDRCLWTFDDVEFLPHARWPAPAGSPRVKVWLTQDPTECDTRDVLVNLGVAPPEGYAQYQRLIEVVSQDEADRAAARLRWKHYSAQGDAIVRHEVAP